MIIHHPDARISEDCQEANNHLKEETLVAS